MKPFQQYLNVRQKLIQMGYDNDNADDVKDVIVELTADFVHLNDIQLRDAYIRYREFETANPEYVQRGDALIA